MDQIECGFRYWITHEKLYKYCNYDHLLELTVSRQKIKIRKYDPTQSQFFGVLPTIEPDSPAENGLIL